MLWCWSIGNQAAESVCMFEQQSFEGFEPGGKRKRPAGKDDAPHSGEEAHGFLLAVRPDPPAQALLLKLAALEKAAHRLKGRPRPAQVLHATLFSLGRYEGPDEGVDHDLDTVKAVCAQIKHAPFDVRLDRVLSFNGGNDKKAIVAAGGEGTAALAGFRETLRVALAGAGWSFRNAYTPHITLLYDQGEVAEHEIAPIVWTARSFALIHSNIGKSRHDLPAQWALGGSPS
jgi:2'-5' RNA ligase